MPIQRFKSFEEAQRALWLPPGDPALVATWRTLSAMAAAFAPVCPPRRGVFKFKTIEEANADAEAWIQRRVDAGRQRRR